MKNGKRLLAATAMVFVLSAGCESLQEEKLSTVTSPPPKKPDKQALRRLDDLTIPLIMQGPGLVGTSPSQVRFSADGAQVYFHWNSPERLDSLNALDPENAYEHYVSLEDDAGTYALTVASGAIRKLTDEEADTLVASQGVWNKARTRRAEIRAGDVYLTCWQVSTVPGRRLPVWPG